MEKECASPPSDGESRMRLAPFLMAVLLAGCSPVQDEQGAAPVKPDPGPDPGSDSRLPPDDPAGTDRTPSANPAQDPRPTGVTVAADPPPPFTYWAPPGSVIRNHGNPGLWVAVLNGRQVKTYFGDECAASRLQGWIGMRVDELPALPPVLPQRNFARDEPVTQDLRPNRINVIYDGATRRVEEVACF